MVGVTQGITQLQIQWNMPIAFGVLTVNDMQQALDRCGGRHGNKGDEAAATAINMVKLQIDETMTFARGISDGSVKIRFYCEANTTGGTEPNGGTIRWASSADNGYNDSPVIQVVE